MHHSSDKLSIRLATAADVTQLSKLLSILFAQEADFAPDTERQTRGLRLIIEQPTVGRIYCASESRKIVGMASLLFTVSTAEGGWAAWLEDMVVSPDWRGQGVGKRLLSAAIAGAREAGCSRITLLTDADNHSAMRFYQRAGFVRSQMIPFRLSLRAGD